MTCRVLAFPDRRRARSLGTHRGRPMTPASAAADRCLIRPAAGASGGASSLGDAPPVSFGWAAVGWRLGAFAAVAWTVALLLELAAALLRQQVPAW